MIFFCSIKEQYDEIAKTHPIQLAILFFDLDGLKYINDFLGHEMGDKVLQYFAEQLKNGMNENDLAVRLGGDEFVLLINRAQPHRHALQTANRLLEQLKEPVLIDGHSILINSSIGISLYPEHSENIQTLLKQADTALYQAKALNKGNHQLYTSELNQQLAQKYQQEIELRQALDQQQFCMYYQPIYSATTGDTVYFEALIRWHHPQKGFIQAKDFIPLAEKTGFIVQLGEWILNTGSFIMRPN